MSVLLAAQTLNLSVAAGINMAVATNTLTPEAVYIAGFCEKMNQLFDRHLWESDFKQLLHGSNMENMIIWLFDQSSGHTKMGKDSFNASELNKKSGANNHECRTSFTMESYKDLFSMMELQREQRPS